MSSVVQNVLGMKQYFDNIFSADISRANTLLSAGCYTFSMCSALLLAIPSQEQIDYGARTMKLSFADRILKFRDYAAERLQILHAMRDLEINTHPVTAQQGDESVGDLRTALRNQKNEISNLKKDLARKTQLTTLTTTAGDPARPPPPAGGGGGAKGGGGASVGFSFISPSLSFRDSCCQQGFCLARSHDE